MRATFTRLIISHTLILLISIVAQGQARGKTRSETSKHGARRGAARLWIIDAHTHTDFTGEREKTSGIPKTEEQYFSEWRRARIVAAIAHTPINKATPDLRDRHVITCVGVGAQPDGSAIEEGLRTGRYGCVKIYLGYVHQSASDKNYTPVYELAEKYNVPVVFHTGDTYSIEAKVKFADPLAIDEVAVDHRGVTFVIAHCGNPWIESAAEVAYKNPNVYLDGSAFLIGDLNKMPKQKVDTYVVKPLSWVFGYLENPHKLMFGSDWPLADIASYVRAFKRAIPRRYWAAVFHDNAVQVFHLKPDGKSSAKISH